MDSQIIILMWTAVTIGFVHTLIGPDHYLPFIALGKAKKWSMKKTVIITSLCGLGHVLSSILIGFIGLWFSVALNKLEFIEDSRGDIAAWLLTSFGLLYFIYGIRCAIKNKKHTHHHVHNDGEIHLHEHNHHKEHAHIHETKSKTTPWVLFIIFVFGPCEPLIPILMYPAAKESLTGLLLVVAAFAIVTIGTMLTMVMVSLYGLKLAFFDKLEKYSRALAGLVLFASGVAILAGL